jgi:hypothetical protein
MPTKDHIFSDMNRSFKLLNSLAILATIYFISSIVTRVIGVEDPSIFGIPVGQGNAVFVLALCTVLHIGILRYIIHYTRIAWMNLNNDERLELYFQLAGSNHLLTQGAERLRDSIHNNNGFLFVRVEKVDPPSMLHWGMFFVAVVASVRYELSFDFVWTFILGLTLSMANWQIGSSWLVALADIGRQSDQSLYFDDLNKSGPRYFGIVSGPWHGMNNNIFVFSAISLLDALIRVLPLSTAIFVVWAILETFSWFFQ